MIRPLFFACLLGIAAGFSTRFVAAETLLLDDIKARETQATELPQRGQNMDKIKAQFGEPIAILPAVGEPPITRWEYPNFVVYFEYQIALHTVAKPYVPAAAESAAPIG